MMVLNPRNIIMALWMSVVMLAHAHGFADAVVSTRLASGNPAIAGSTFSVAVDVVSDAEVPHAVALRLTYPTDSVDFVSVDDGVLGPATEGAAVVSGTSAYRNVATLGSSAHGTTSALAFTANFRTRLDAVPSFDIGIEADPSTPANVIGANPFPTLASTYDSASTTDLAPSVERATITATVPAAPAAAGDQFTVVLGLADAPTGVAPSAFAVRVNYNGDLVNYVGVADGGLGPVLVGPEMGVAPNNYREVASLGDVTNSNLTPALATLTFEVEDCLVADSSIAIGVGESANANEALVNVNTATTMITALAADFDATGASGFNVTKHDSSFAFAGSTVTFTGTEREANPANQTVTLNNSIACPADVTFSSNAAWLSVAPTTATLPASGSTDITLSVDNTGLAAGTYDAVVTAADSRGTFSTTIDVQFVVTELPSVLVATSVDAAPATAGDVFKLTLAVADNPITITPTAALVRVSFDGALVAPVAGSEQAGDLGPVSVSPVLGTSPNNYVIIGTLGNTANSSALPTIATLGFEVAECLAGSSSISLTASEDPSADSPLVDIVVAPPATNKILATFDNTATTGFTVTPDAADIDLAPATFAYSGFEREFAPVDATTVLSNLTACSTDVTISSDAAWLTVAPTSASLAGNADQNLTLTVNPGNLAAGVYTGTVTATSADGLDTASAVVTLTLNALPTVGVVTSIDTVPTAAGDVFKVSLAVSDNPTTVTPTAALVRVSFDSSVLDIVTGSLEAGDLGPASISPVQGTAPSNYVVIGTLGDVNNANPTPAIAALSFRVKECLQADSTFSVVVSEDPSADSPLVKVVAAPPATFKVLATFDSSATSNISVTAAPEAIAFAPNTLNLSVNEGEVLASTTVDLSNTAACDTPVTIASNAAWLSVAPTSATVSPTTSTLVSLTFDTAGLMAGVYNGTVTASSVRGASASVDVTLTVVADPVIALSTNSIVATVDAGTTVSIPFTVSNTGEQALNYTASDDAAWLTLSPAAGTLAGGASEEVAVVVDATALAPQIAPYTATITVEDPNAPNSPQTIDVAITVVGGQATIAVAPDSISRTVNEGSNALPQNLNLSNTGTNVLNYTASVNQPWLTVGPTSGTLAPGGNTVLTVTFDVAALPPTAVGSPLTANVVVSAPNVSNPTGQFVVPVTVTILEVINPAVIASTILSGNPCVPNSEFVVRYAVATNGETGLIARNFTFSVEYNDNAIEFVSATRGELGTLDVVNNPPAPTNPANNRTYVLTSNFFFGNPNDSTPVLADVRFRVKETGFLAPYSITMAEFAPNFPLTGGLPNTSIGSTRINSVFDASATSNLGLCPILDVTPNTIALGTIEFGDSVADANATVANVGNQPLSFTVAESASWLSVSPVSGSLAPATTTSLTLSFDTAGLPGGTYNADVTVSAAGAVGTPEVISVSLTVNDPNPPTLTVSPTSIVATANERTNPASQSVVLGAEGLGGALTYTLTSNQTWVTPVPASGTIDLGTTTTVALNFSTSTLAPGVYNATITPTGNFGNTPPVITVNLTINDVIVPPADSVAFSFDADEEGWTFGSPSLDLAGIGLSDVGSSNAGAVAGSLDLNTSTTKTFAFWESPRFQIVTDNDVVSPGSRGISGSAGADSLFRLAVNVSTDVTSKALVPTFRIRSSSWDWQQSDVLVVTSTEDLSATALEFLPDAAGRTYVQHFTQPATSNEFRATVDVINFIPLDQAVATLSVNSVDVTALSRSMLSATLVETPVASFDLTTGTNGFTSGTLTSLFGAPIFTADANGLGITGVDVAPGAIGNPIPNPNLVIDYGVWELAATGANFVGGTVYRVDFTVASNAPTPEVVPTFRLRTNASSQVFASYVNINSSDANSVVPTDGNPVTYSMFIETPTEIDGDFWIFAFEYIYSDSTNDSRSASIFLQNLSVTAYQAP